MHSKSDEIVMAVIKLQKKFPQKLRDEGASQDSLPLRGRWPEGTEGESFAGV